MAPTSTVTLAWRVQDGGLAGNALKLVDQASGAVLVADMTATMTYEFSGNDRSLLVLYGPANYPPVARGDEFALLAADGSIEIPFAALLANDYDPDGDGLDVVAVGDPFVTLGGGKGASAYGTTAIDTDARVVTYTLPGALPADWDGTVYFQYTIRDDDPTAPYETAATVTMTVAPHVLTLPLPQQVAAHPGAPFTATYTLVYSGALHSLSLAFTLPTAGSGAGMTFWPFAAGSYSDDAATADPAIDDGSGVDGDWGTPDDSGVVVLDFGTDIPPSGTTFSFLVNVPVNATDAALPSRAQYKVSGAEPDPLEQNLPNLAVKMAYTVTFASAGNGAVQGELTQLVGPGSPSTAVTAVPALGYHFAYWLRDGVLLNGANPLVVTGGAADTSIVAVFETNTYTITFNTIGNGILSGPPTQQVEHGADAAAVTAVPGADSSFSRWVQDGSTENPRTVRNVMADATYTAEFVLLVPLDPPFGDFELLYRDPSNPGPRRIWDFTGGYAGDAGAYHLTLQLLHDEKGSVTGLGRLRGEVGGQAFDVGTMPVRAKCQGKLGTVTIKGSLAGSGGATKVSLKLTLTLDAATMSLTGMVTGRITDGVGGRAAVSAPCALALPADMDGTYRLPVSLHDGGGAAIAGRGTLILANDRPVELLIKGRRAAGLALLRAVGDRGADPAFGAVALNLTIRTYTDGTADFRATTGKAFGQSLRWPR
jgi:hypothetical protein